MLLAQEGSKGYDTSHQTNEKGVEPPALSIGMNLDDEDPRLAVDILGTDDVALIEPAISAFCREHLGQGVARVRYTSFSVGAGFGLMLDDGQSVFLKVWSPATSLTSLESIHVIQNALATQGFPAPRVLVPPRAFMAGNGAVMEWCERGTQLDAHAAPLRRALATSLAQLVALATPFADLPELPRHDYPTNSAFGAAHNILFDFHASRRGAEWIDEIAIASARIAQQSPSTVVIGHRDWSMHNLRLQNDANADPAVSAVYDWDSLAVARETDIVGMAAAMFTVTWSLDVVPRFPTREEMVAFVVDYEDAAGHCFSASEWECIGAAATYILAYVARCEHCAGWPEDAQSARASLRKHITGGRTFVRPAV